MAQPVFATSGGRAIAKFGNAPQPNGQGNMTYLDLHDCVRSFVTTFQSDDDNVLNGVEQLLYRSRGALVSDDRGPRHISLPMQYLEDSTHILGDFLGRIDAGGIQQLTFDNATFGLCKYDGTFNRVRQQMIADGLWAWTFDLHLLAPSPWWQDAAATTQAPLTINSDTNYLFNITYAGTWWTEPVFTYVVPAGGGQTINAVQIRNTMSGEFLTVNFQSVLGILTGGVARTVTIDSAAMTAVDNLGNVFDTYGTFPNLYGPPGQVNPFQVVTTPASGSSSGTTIGLTHYPRWKI